MVYQTKADLRHELKNSREAEHRFFTGREEYKKKYWEARDELIEARKEVQRLTKSPLTVRLEAAGAKRLPPNHSYVEETSDSGAVYIHVTTPKVVDWIWGIEAPVTLGKAQILGGVDKAGIIAAANHAYKAAFPKESMDADAKTLLYGEKG